MYLADEAEMWLIFLYSWISMRGARAKPSLIVLQKLVCSLLKDGVSCVCKHRSCQGADNLIRS